MDLDNTPYLNVNDEQYLRYAAHIEEIGLKTSDGKFLDQFPSLATVSVEDVKFIWQDAGVKEVPPNIGMEIFTSIVCGYESDEEVNEIFEDKRHNVIHAFDLLLKSQEVSPTHLIRFQLNNTYYYTNNLKRLQKRKNEELDKKTS